MPILLARLKSETESHHRLIEQDLDPLAANFTLADYRALLERFFGYYAPWESGVRAFDPALLQGRYKSASLVADLNHLGSSPAESFRLPRCRALPALDTPARIFGSMYVLEGATLGGQLLRKHFSAKFGFNGHGCAFFAGYGERTSDMWKRFGETLNTIPEADSNAVVASAIATFETMHAWLCEPL